MERPFAARHRSQRKKWQSHLLIRLALSHDRPVGTAIMDRIEAGFFVTAVTSAIVLVAAVTWLAAVL